MPRQYTKVEILSEEVNLLKAAGKTNREIGESFGLSKAQIKGLVRRQNKKARMVSTAISHVQKGGHTNNQRTRKRSATAN